MSLVDTITAYVASSPLNRLRDIDGSPIFEEPLVGFADGDDPLFELFKSVVTPEHQMPREALAAHLREAGEDDGRTFEHVGVVAWILPVAAATRLSNEQMVDGPSLRWNHTRIHGESFNESLRRHVLDTLHAQGVAAAGPAIGKDFRRTRGPYGTASIWSERHIAFAAGLGTFGLSDGLITARGIAHRCGSVVAGVSWPASPRPYADHHQYCLHFRDGSCGECIYRCPAGAIGPDGHDKDRCEEYVHITIGDWQRRPGYLGGQLACGLCQTGVPCEAGIP